jgi:hypothetical protein
VVDGGKDLTRAQKQLLNLARIVLHQPPVVLLDEATNGLDAADEGPISRIHFGHNLRIYNFKSDNCEFLQVGFLGQLNPNIYPSLSKKYLWVFWGGNSIHRSFVKVCQKPFGRNGDS